MSKLNVQQLKEILVNKEMSYIELDNEIMNSGYYSNFDDGTVEDVKENLNTVYTAKDTCECEIQIDFIITINNDTEESEEYFYLKVIDVTEY